MWPVTFSDPHARPHSAPGAASELRPLSELVPRPCLGNSASDMTVHRLDPCRRTMCLAFRGALNTTPSGYVAQIAFQNGAQANFWKAGRCVAQIGDNFRPKSPEVGQPRLTSAKMARNRRNFGRS